MSIDIQTENNFPRTPDDWQTYLAGNSSPSPNGHHEEEGNEGTDPETERRMDLSSDNQYFKEMSKVKLLTARDEIDLAKKIEAGVAATQELRDKNNPPSEERIDDLLSLISQGESAKNHLSVANLRLVVSVARRYQNRGLDLLDLVQEGNLGLARAVEKFDWHRGFKFSTYATWWIRQAVTRALADQGNTIRKPVHLIEAIGQINRASRIFFQEFGREPTFDDLAAATEMSEDKVGELLQIFQPTVDLSTPMGDGDLEFGDFLPGSEETEKAVLEGAEKEIVSNALERGLGRLTPRERAVIRVRHGLDGKGYKTLEQTGLVFGVTRERIRQIESKAFRKIKKDKEVRAAWMGGQTMEILVEPQWLAPNPTSYSVWTRIAAQIGNGEVPMIAQAIKHPVGHLNIPVEPQGPSLPKPAEIIPTRTRQDLTQTQERFVRLHAQLNDEGTYWRYPNYEQIVVAISPKGMPEQPQRKYFDTYWRIYSRQLNISGVKLEAAQSIQEQNPAQLSLYYRELLQQLRKEHGPALQLSHLVRILEGDYEGRSGFKKFKRDLENCAQDGIAVSTPYNVPAIH